MSLIYYLIFFLLVVTSYFEFSKNEKGSKQWYYAIVILMMFTAGLGYALSPDWIAYHKTFLLVGDIEWSELDNFSEMASMEKGFLSLNKISW